MFYNPQISQITQIKMNVGWSKVNFPMFAAGKFIFLLYRGPIGHYSMIQHPTTKPLSCINNMAKNRKLSETITQFIAI